MPRVFDVLIRSLLTKKERKKILVLLLLLQLAYQPTYLPIVLADTDSLDVCIEAERETVFLRFKFSPKNFFFTFKVHR